jgi:4-amino-4-deoxy-L-arabinose transferase-like glycosyltransferase
MTILREPIDRAAGRDRLVVSVWLLWTAVVLARYFVQLWRGIAVRSPDLAATFRYAGVAALKCAIVGAAALGAAAAVHVTVTRLRRRLPFRGDAALLAAGGAASALWLLSKERLAVFITPIVFDRLPAFGEAMARAGGGIAGAALVTLAAWSLGRIGAARIRSDLTGAEFAFVALTAGFAALSLAWVALAAAGVYRPEAVGLLLVLAPFAAALDRWRAAPGANVASAPTAAVHGTSGSPAATAAWTPDAAWIALAFIAGSFAFVAALAPETEFDALWYHLYLPRRWLEAGHAVDLITEYPSLYPLGWEMIFGAGLVAGGAVAAKLLHFVCLAILAAAVAVAVRRYLPGTSPAVAAALLILMPTVSWEAATAYVDLALAMYAAVACYALARFVDTRRQEWLIVAALEFGAAASTKHLALVVLAIALAALSLAQRARGLAWTVVARQCLTVALVALAVALPWYVRAWRGSGNPFFPELYGLLGGGPAERWDAATERALAAFKAHFGYGRSLDRLLRLPWDVTIHGAAFGGTFGALPLVLLPACAAGGRLRRPTIVLGAGVAAYVAVWASPISSFQLRFLVPVAAAAAMLCADGYMRLRRSAAAFGVRAPNGVDALLIAVACLSLPPFTPLNEPDRAGWDGWLTHVLREPPVAVVVGGESERVYLTRALPSYAAWSYADTHLPEDAVVLSFSGGDQWYSHRARIPHDATIARHAVWTARSTGEMLRGLNALGVTDVLFDRRVVPELQKYGAAMGSEPVQGWCIDRWSDRRFRLCGVDYGSFDAVR